MRLGCDSFEASLPVNGHDYRVAFGPEWPGDAIGFFPALAEQTRQDPETVPWGGAMIEKASGAAVGHISCKSLPDEQGRVEIGYGVNPSAEGHGYATEAASALAEWALARPDVRVVTAECLDTNVGSKRVLEKAGFRKVGERYDAEEGGTLLLWERG